MILYAINGVFLRGIIGGRRTITDAGSYRASNLPYLVYPLLLLATLLSAGRRLAVRR